MRALCTKDAEIVLGGATRSQGSTRNGDTLQWRDSASGTLEFWPKRAYEVTVSAAEEAENSALLPTGSGWAAPFQKCRVDSDCVRSHFALKRGDGHFRDCKVLFGGIPVARGVARDALKAAIPKMMNVLEDDCWRDALHVELYRPRCALGLCSRTNVTPASAALR